MYFRIANWWDIVMEAVALYLFQSDAIISTLLNVNVFACSL